MVWGRVVLKFGGGKEVKSRFGVVGAKDTKICFYFLVGAFRLSVSLGVVGSGESDVVLEESG